MAKNETNAKNSAQNSQDEQSKNGAKQAYKNANDTKSCTSDYKVYPCSRKCRILCHLHFYMPALHRS